MSSFCVNTPARRWYVYESGPSVTTSNTCTSICGSSAIPATSQSTSCATGYTGTATQTRTNTCNASTGYAWTSSAWVTTSTAGCTLTPPGSCSSVPSSWGGSCAGAAAVPLTASGNTVSIANVQAGYTGTLKGQCTNGSWAWVGSTCATVQCPASTGLATWGLGGACNGATNAPVTNAGGTYTFDATSITTGKGKKTWTCGSTGAWVEGAVTCEVINPPAPTVLTGNYLFNLYGRGYYSCGATYYPATSKITGTIVAAGDPMSYSWIQIRYVGFCTDAYCVAANIGYDTTAEVPVVRSSVIGTNIQVPSVSAVSAGTCP